MLPLQLEVRDRLGGDRVTDQPMRLIADQDLPRHRYLLQSRRGVHHIAQHHLIV